MVITSQWNIQICFFLFLQILKSGKFLMLWMASVSVPDALHTKGRADSLRWYEIRLSGICTGFSWKMRFTFLFNNLLPQVLSHTLKCRLLPLALSSCETAGWNHWSTKRMEETANILHLDSDTCALSVTDRIRSERTLVRQIIIEVWHPS